MRAPKSFEEGMDRLNAVLAKMQDEQTTLAEAVKLYAEAASLMQYCHATLEKTSLQIEEISAKIAETVEAPQEQEEE
jgi:exodeoxyribonuclease VII small subunit